MEYATYTKGAGRIAAARQPWSDPVTLAAEAHMLLSRRNDVVRLYNGGSSIVVYTRTAGKARLQILNFAAQGWGFPMTVYVGDNYGAARLGSFELDADKPLELVKREAGAEIRLPQFSVYANIELGG